MARKIGITGGIGSGKSIVSKIIETMGYPVFNSDREAKIIVNSHPEVKYELIKLFGTSIYCDNELNRKKLAEIIFYDPTLRGKVNRIIHPKVREEFNNRASASSSILIFNEAAILFETGAYKQFDATILITAPKELRIRRVSERDKVSLEEIENRMASQWTDEKKSQFTNYIINNDEVEPLIIQIEKVISELLN